MMTFCLSLAQLATDYFVINAAEWATIVCNYNFTLVN